MPVFDAETLTRFFQEGEDLFVELFPCIIERVGLATTAGTAEYTLSEEIFSIRRVTWKGIPVQPMPYRFLRDEFQGLQFTQQGRPDYYVFNNITTQRTIRFHPIPNETISAQTTNLYGSNMGNCVILEYYRLSDHATKVIPLYFRRQLLKCYVAMRCFQIESKGQNLKNSDYWRNRWEFLSQRYGNLINELSYKSRRLVKSPQQVFSGGIARPQLPYVQQGIGVDPGE